MADKIYNVLFLCTGNSARSIIAETTLNALGEGRFQAWSAGSHPRGAVHPVTLEVLRAGGHRVDGLRSKRWDEFAAPGAPEMDFVFTVCDRAAGELCPVWPGQPISAHWGFADPVAVQGDPAQVLRAFQQVHKQIVNRIRLFLSLPVDKLDRVALKREVVRIGTLPADGEA